MPERDKAAARAIRAAEAKECWDRLLAEVSEHGKRAVVVEHGVPAAGIVSAKER